MINQKFEELKHTGNLPSPSGVGLTILRLTQSTEHTLDELAKCVQADPSLTGRLLRLANTTRGNGEEPVGTVAQAAQLLGLRAVRNVALGFSLVSAHRAGACPAFDYDRYWSRSIACAVAAERIAERSQGFDPAEAFTCGLLSQIGMLALASVHADTYGDVVARAGGASESELLAEESRAYDITHVEITASMLSDWGLPRHFPSAIEVWSSPGESDAEDAPTRALALVLEVASKIADILLSDWDHESEEYAAAWVPLRESARRLGLDEERCFATCAAIAREWREWGEFFRLPTRANAGFADAAEAPAKSPLASLRALRPPSDASKTAAAVRDEPSEPSGAPIRVLVVDDDQRLLRLVALHLERAGYEVTTAEDGKAGLAIALRDAPDIIVSDWTMPELSGVELCKALRRAQSGHRTYVLLLTAREEEDRIVDAFDAGVDDYVAKPFNARILLARVQAGHRLIGLQRRVEADKVVRSKQVAEMGLLTRRLRAAALTDVLTELPNRRYAVQRLVQEWDAAVRLGRSLSVVLLDVDHFKSINDRHGHAVGDRVLQATAEVLRRKTRRSDIVCRWGGEEFLVINVNSDVEGALRCAERLRRSVEAHEILCEGFRGFVTASLGIAQKSNATEDIDALIKLADQAVYEAKKAGRNTVRGGPSDSTGGGFSRSA